MSNGDMDLNNWKNVSKTMLVSLESRGLLHTRPLSDYARKALEQLSMEYINNYLGSQKRATKISEKEQRWLSRTSMIFEHYSDEDLAYFDTHGIEVIGIKVIDDMYDDFNDDWAD